MIIGVRRTPILLTYIRTTWRLANPNFAQSSDNRQREGGNIMAVKSIPDGYHSATPYLIVGDAAGAIEYYKKAFAAIEIMRFPMPNGKIGHAEIKIGDSPIMLADEYPEMGYKSPKSFGGSPVSIMLYVDDVDAVFGRAVAEGASVNEAVQDKFYGDRSGTVTDPFGHVWHISTHKEDVSLEEMQRRVKAHSAEE
jgi:PhnB protein